MVVGWRVDLEFIKRGAIKHVARGGGGVGVKA